jgi:HPt (histidine-containing phosphotransfer) domain-containing protein
MNDKTIILFDKTALPTSLGTSDADVLIQFYEMFIQITLDSWGELSVGNSTHDFKLVRQIAHKLKSSSASIGAMALAQSLKELEVAATESNLLRVIEKTEHTTRLLEDTVAHVRAELASLQQELSR